MLKLTGYILSFYILFCTVVPCALFDNCEDKPITEQRSGDATPKDCTNCSPFSICTSTHWFTNNPGMIAIQPYYIAADRKFPDQPADITKQHSPTLFQPPRA